MAEDAPRGPPDISGMCSLKVKVLPAVPFPFHSRATQVDNLGYSASQDEVREAVRRRAGWPRAGTLGGVQATRATARTRR